MKNIRVKGVGNIDFTLQKKRVSPAHEAVVKENAMVRRMLKDENIVLAEKVAKSKKKKGGE